MKNKKRTHKTEFIRGYLDIRKINLDLELTDKEYPREYFIPIQQIFRASPTRLLKAYREELIIFYSHYSGLQTAHSLLLKNYGLEDKVEEAQDRINKKINKK